MKTLTVSLRSLIRLTVSRFFDIIASFPHRKLPEFRRLIAILLIPVLLLTSTPPAVYTATVPRYPDKPRPPFAANASTEVRHKAVAPSAKLPAAKMFPVLPAMASTETAVVRRVLNLNSGRLEGSVQQLEGESLTLDGSTVITHDLLVPGTPGVQTSGTPSFGGVVEGTGSLQPSNYTVAIRGNASLRHLVTRTEPINLLAVTHH